MKTLDHVNDIANELVRTYATTYFEMDRQSPLSEQEQARPLWTGRVHELIGNYGLKLGYYVGHKKQPVSAVYSGNPKYRTQEWLFDLIWENDDPFWIPLAMESEWESARTDLDDGWSRLYHDLFKLLAANTDVKVMAFRTSSVKDAESYRKGIQEDVSGTRKCGSQYISIAHIVTALESAHTTAILVSVNNEDGEVVHEQLNERSGS